MNSNTPPDPEFMWQLLVGIQFLLNLTLGVFAFWKGSRPQPALHQEYATKRELLEQRDLITARLVSIEHRMDRESETAEERTKALHERINLILTAVSRIEGKCTAYHHPQSQ